MFGGFFSYGLRFSKIRLLAVQHRTYESMHGLTLVPSNVRVLKFGVMLSRKDLDRKEEKKKENKERTHTHTRTHRRRGRGSRE